MDKPIGLPRRKALRLRDYDYSSAGFYFLTICTQGKRCLFGEVINGAMLINPVGNIVQSMWSALCGLYRGLLLDQFVVMPNHVHAIVMLRSEGAMNRAPTTEDNSVGAQFIAPVSLGDVVRGFKARCSIEIRKQNPCFAGAIWQRNYYEHVIRNEASLLEIRQYIVNNPAQWALDRENPEFKSNGV